MMYKLMDTMSEDMKKRNEAMLKRLKGLDKKNPVVKQAIISNKPQDDYEKQWGTIDELIVSAKKQCRDGMDFSMCLTHLADAIEELAGEKETEND